MAPPHGPRRGDKNQRQELTEWQRIIWWTTVDTQYLSLWVWPLSVLVCMYVCVCACLQVPVCLRHFEQVSAWGFPVDDRTGGLDCVGCVGGPGGLGNDRICLPFLESKSFKGALPEVGLFISQPSSPDRCCHSSVSLTATPSFLISAFLFVYHSMTVEKTATALVSNGNTGMDGGRRWHLAVQIVCSWFDS